MWFGGAGVGWWAVTSSDGGSSWRLTTPRPVVDYIRHRPRAHARQLQHTSCRREHTTPSAGTLHSHHLLTAQDDAIHINTFGHTQHIEGQGENSCRRVPATLHRHQACVRVSATDICTMHVPLPGALKARTRASFIRWCNSMPHYDVLY